MDIGQTRSNGTPSNGNGIALNDPTFQTVTATYIRDSLQNITMPLSTGAFTSTYTNTNYASFDNAGVGIRLFPATGNPANSYLFDQFVAAIPEPGTASLLGLGLAGLAVLRRRKNA